MAFESSGVSAHTEDTQSCKSGTPEAQFACAASYLSGDEGGRDVPRGAKLLSAACEGGHAAACSDLGVLFFEGRGVEQDPDRAEALFQHACAEGYPAGCYNLGLLLESTQADPLALGQYRKSCTGGYEPACAKLAGTVETEPSAKESSASDSAAPAASESPDSAASSDWDEVVPAAAAETCTLWGSLALPEGCWTPRSGIVSGGFFGFDVSYLALHASSRRRHSLGDGYAWNIRFGIALWDQLLLGLSFGGLRPVDHARTSEWVIWCTKQLGAAEQCDQTPSRLKSEIKGGYISPEIGYQYRFRPARWISMAPAVLVGYQAVNGLRRVLDCEGCPSPKSVGIDMDGTHLTGLARVTFGRHGFVGVVCRSQWFLAGAVRHMTGFGFELISP